MDSKLFQRVSPMQAIGMMTLDYPALLLSLNSYFSRLSFMYMSVVY